MREASGPSAALETLTLHWAWATRSVLRWPREAASQVRSLGSVSERRQRPPSAVWKGPVPGLVVQMF